MWQSQRKNENNRLQQKYKNSTNDSKAMNTNRDKSVRLIRELKLRMLVKSSDVAGKLFQTFTTRLQRKYFRTSTRLWHTNSLQVCPRVVSFELTVKNLEQSRSTRPKILYVYMRSPELAVFFPSGGHEREVITSTSCAYPCTREGRARLNWLHTITCHCITDLFFFTVSCTFSELRRLKCRKSTIFFHTPLLFRLKFWGVPFGVDSDVGVRREKKWLS